MRETEPPIEEYTAPQEDLSPRASDRHFIPKTPAELRHQQDLTEAYYWSQASYSAKMDLDWLGATAAEGLTRLRQERERDRTDFEQSDKLYQYNRYLETLRSLRRAQRGQIAQAMSGDRPEPDGRQAYLESVNYCSAIQEQILNKLNTGETFRLSRAVTEDEIVRGSHDRAAFNEVFMKIFQRRPDSIVHIVDTLPAFFDEREIRNILDIFQRKDTVTWLIYLDKYRSLYQPHEIQAITVSYLDEHPPFATTFFDHENNRALFTTAEIQSRLRAALVTKLDQPGAWLTYDNENISQYVSEGLLTAEDIQDYVRRAIEKKSFGVDLLTRMRTVVSDEFRSTLHDDILAAFTRTNETAPLASLSALADLLGPEACRTLILQRVQAKPEELMDNLDLAQKLLAPEEFTATVAKFSAALLANSYPSWFALRQFFESKLISGQEKTALAEQLLADRPDNALEYSQMLFAHLEPDTRVERIRAMVERSSPHMLLANHEQWLPYLTTDPQEQKRYLLELTNANPSMALVEMYATGNKDRLVRQLFTREEIQALLIEQAELNPGVMYVCLKEVRDILGSDAELKAMVLRTAPADPSAFFYHTDELAYLFDPAEFSQLIGTMSSSVKGLSAAVNSIDTWASLVADQSLVTSIIARAEQEDPLAVFSQLDKCLNYIPVDQQVAFIDRLTRQYPPLAMYRLSVINSRLPDLTTDQIITNAEADPEYMSLAPKSLHEIYKKIRKTAPDTLMYQTYLGDAFTTYRSINTIRRTALDQVYARVYTRSKITQRQESDMLAVYECLALLREQDPAGFGPQVEKGETLDEAKMILFNELAHQTGIEETVTTEQMQNFFMTMESPAPFMTYVLQRKSSPEHMVVLVGLLRSMMTKTYLEWKYGGAEQENLTRLKEQQLLPPSLDAEQYRQWQQTEQTELQGTLAVDAGQVALQIAEYLGSNAEHLRTAAGEHLLGQPEEPAVMAEKLRACGQELAGIHRQLTLLKRTSETDTDLADLERQRRDAEQRRDTWQSRLAVRRLLDLKPPEIASGYLLDGERLEKKVMKLERLLTDISDALLPADRFTIENVRKLLSDFTTQARGTENFTCVDTDDPKITLEIGDKPVASCQHYGHGSFNECLTAYFDPDSKILLLKNEQGRSIARAIFRMLSLPDGRPALHLEKIYSSSASTAVPRIMMTHALSKASRLGMPIYISRQAQDAAGTETASDLPSGFTFVASTDTLSSRGSRSPRAYVDSAGGVRTKGQYVITDCFKIERQSQP